MREIAFDASTAARLKNSHAKRLEQSIRRHPLRDAGKFQRKFLGGRVKSPAMTE